MEARSPARSEWREPDPVSAHDTHALREFTRLPRSICELLARRGFTPSPDVARFLRPTLRDLHQPTDLPDLSAGVARIELAIRSGESILVHGDYDVDGMSGAALLTRAFRDLGADVQPFVPHRARDGYDLGRTGLELASRRGVSLVVTADCGTTALETIELAGRRGIDVVVTDHHRPGETLPGACAVINPGRVDSRYPFPHLSGVGVAFKLVQELLTRQRVDAGRINQHIDLVALGTIADQVPLVGENRILARVGLKVLDRSRKPGLRALMREANVGRWAAARSTDVAYRIAPRLNSAGRIGEPMDGVRLLTTNDVSEGQRLASQVGAQNAERRELDRELLEVVRLEVRRTFEPNRDRAIVVWGEGWHPGVLGIVASRLVDELHRPVALISLDGDSGRGSARSVAGFHLFEALKACAGSLERFGGHAMAAGFDARRDRLPELRRRLLEVARLEIADTGMDPRLEVDLEIALSEVDSSFARAFGHLEPFGAQNPAPRIVARRVKLRDVEPVGADASHLRFHMAQGTASLEAIAFGFGDRRAELADGSPRDVVFELHIDVSPRGLRPQAHAVAIESAC